MNIVTAFFVGQLWWYGAAVLRPAQLLKSYGWLPENSIGRRPRPRPGKGGGRFFSLKHRRPVLMKNRPEGYELVEEFDETVDMYDTALQPFAGPILEETLEALKPYLSPRSRILDTSCGTGRDVCRLAELVPEGEVVGADLAEKMVKQAAVAAREKGFSHTAFFQANLGALPRDFQGRFDVVYCMLSFHHYPEPLAALKEMRRALRKGGHVFITDAGPSWMKTLGSPMAKLGDPGWIAFRTGEEYRDLCAEAGFSEFYWTEILPGMGLTIATR